MNDKENLKALALNLLEKEERRAGDRRQSNRRKTNGIDVRDIMLVVYGIVLAFLVYWVGDIATEQNSRTEAIEKARNFH